MKLSDHWSYSNLM